MSYCAFYNSVRRNPPVHFLLLSSFLEELISLQLKFSSQYSANHTFLRLFSSVRDVKYASNPERRKTPRGQQHLPKATGRLNVLHVNPEQVTY